MSKLNPIEHKILTVLLKTRRFMTTSSIAQRARISWNTAEKYLNDMFEKGWVDVIGDRTKYWKVIAE